MKRAKAKQHTRKLKSGKTVIVNKGVTKQRVTRKSDEKSRLQRAIAAERDWLYQYHEHIENGTWPELEFNSEAEFNEDVRRTEENVSRLSDKIVAIEKAKSPTIKKLRPAITYDLAKKESERGNDLSWLDKSAKKQAAFKKSIVPKVKEVKQPFLLHTNPNNVSNYAYTAIGIKAINEVKRLQRQYPGSYEILYQSKRATNDDLQKAYNMHGGFKFEKKEIK